MSEAFDHLKTRGGWLVNSECKYKRGCAICADAKRINPIKLSSKEFEFARTKKKHIRLANKKLPIQAFIVCPYERCPYTELDRYGSYLTYEKKTKFRIPDLLHLIKEEN